MSYEHRLVEAANGREFYDKIGREADAEIAALTERLRAVEAERDACATGEQCMADEANAKDRENVSLRAQLSALRADLERKDAALKEAKSICDAVVGGKDEEFNRAVTRQWKMSNAHRDICKLILGKLDAALQPKDKQCQS